MTWDILKVGDTYHPVPDFISEWVREEPEEFGIQEVPDMVLEFCELSWDDSDSEISIPMDDWDCVKAMYISGYTNCYDTLSEAKEFLRELKYEFGNKFIFIEF